MIACDSLFFFFWGDFVHGLDFIYLLFALSVVRVVSLLRFCPQTDAEFFFFFVALNWLDGKRWIKEKRKKILGPRLKEKEEFFFLFIFIFIFLELRLPFPKT